MPFLSLGRTGGHEEFYTLLN